MRSAWSIRAAVTQARDLGRIACKLALAGILALPVAGCSKEGPAGFCGAIGTDVVGLESIVSEDGSRSVATWVHVFVEGVTDADKASREAIAEAIRSDKAGFERVRGKAANELRPALDRLYELAQDPEWAQVTRSDPDVQGDVDLVRRFAGADGCDFV
jgi:hypothetical protein